MAIARKIRLLAFLFIFKIPILGHSLLELSPVLLVYPSLLDWKAEPNFFLGWGWDKVGGNLHINLHFPPSPNQLHLGMTWDLDCEDPGKPMRTIGSLQV